MEKYIAGNKEAWEEAFDQRDASWGADINSRIEMEEYPFFNEDTPFRKKGYITEAINAYVQFFFRQYSESEIIATILDANTSSWKVAEKSGFKLIEKKMYKDIDDEKEELYRFYVIRGHEGK